MFILQNFVFERIKKRVNLEEINSPPPKNSMRDQNEKNRNDKNKMFFTLF